VSDLARDVRSQVHESVRDLRAELKQAAREVRRETRSAGRQANGRRADGAQPAPELLAEIEALRVIVVNHARQATAETRAMVVERIRRCRDDVVQALTPDD
jgi:hypothetical protein